MLEPLLLGESKYLEYKQNYTQSLLKTVSSYANYHDGMIVIGLSDEGRVIGIDQPDEMRLSIEQAINDGIEPPPFFEIEKVMVQSKALIVLKVYKGDHTPYTFRQKAYKRMDTSTVAVDRHSYEELILQGRNTSFEELPVELQSLSFLYLERKLKQELGIQYLSDDLLITLRLKVSGRFNHAAMLLSDENPMEHAEIRLIAYEDQTVKAIKDRQTLWKMSVLEQFDQCMDFYRKHINVREIIEGPYRKTVEDIPIVAYREAVANMIVHRDYYRQGSARVEVFADRVEIISPGGLPVGISEEEYVQGIISVARNRILADIFLRLKIIEKLATGVRRIREYYKDTGVKPRFVVAENSIMVVLPKVQAESLQAKTGLSDRLAGMSEKEKQIYAIIRESEPISRSEIENRIGLEKSQTVELINRLREGHLVIQVGRGPSTKYKSAP